MKLIFCEEKSSGLTRIDLVVAVLVMVFLLFFAMAAPVFIAAHQRSSRITCVANLRQLGMALRIWEDDNGNTHGPWTALLKTNAQTVGLNAGHIAWINAMGITNFARSAKILQCPADKETPITTSAAGLKIRISYFLNLDANESYPQQMLSGDDNLEIGSPGGPTVKPGILLLSSNALVWTGKRHRYIGNVALADGSVDQISTAALQNATSNSFVGTPLATNRLAIP